MKSSVFQRFFAIGSLMLAPVAAADGADERFEKMRTQAEALAGLGGFLDKYVANCEGGFAGQSCNQNAAEFRQGANGKRFSMSVSEESTLLAMGNADGESVTLNLTPFFAASNSAITQGAPSRTDAAGNPVMSFISLKGKLPDGWNPAMMARQVQSHALKLQVVFTPAGLWTLPKKGGGKMTGVKAKLDAIRVTVARSGESVAVWFAR